MGVLVTATTISVGIVGVIFRTKRNSKRGTITTNVISSSNRRKLVTSLILVTTTIILTLVLLIVNLNCNIFTEATVNTTLTTSPIPLTTPSPVTTLSPSVGPPFASSQPPILTTNSGRPEADLVGQNTAQVTLMANVVANETTNNGSSAVNSTKADPCISPTPDRKNETSKYFDIDYASRTFQESMVEKGAISLHHYLNGFKELMK